MTTGGTVTGSARGLPPIGAWPGPRPGRYAGALSLPQLGLTSMRARVYSHQLGRFLQPDPIGQAGGINLYDYAGGDPVNGWNPFGLQEIIVTGTRPSGSGFSGGGGGGGSSLSVAQLKLEQLEPLPEIIVTANRRSRPRLLVMIWNWIRPQSEICRRNATTVENGSSSGPVVYGSLGGEGYLGLGGGISAGGYFDTGTGAAGLFGAGESTAVPWSGSLGYGGSAGAQVGVATNLQSFAGDYSVIGVGVGPVGINYSFARDDILSSISISAGPSINLIPWPPLPVSAHYSHGNTRRAPAPLTNLSGCQ